MGDFCLGFTLPSFAKIATATSSSEEYRGIDPDIRDVCVKRSAGTKDLRESPSRVFRLQQRSILFPGGPRKKRLLIPVEPHDDSLFFYDLDVYFA